MRTAWIDVTFAGTWNGWAPVLNTCGLAPRTGTSEHAVVAAACVGLSKPTVVASAPATIAIEAGTASARRAVQVIHVPPTRSRDRTLARQADQINVRPVRPPPTGRETGPQESSAAGR